MDSQTPPQMTSAAPAKNGLSIVWILIILVALALIMFFAFSKKQGVAPTTAGDSSSVLDAGAQVELTSTSNSVQAIDQDYKSADPSNLDAGI